MAAAADADLVITAARADAAVCAATRMVVTLDDGQENTLIDPQWARNDHLWAVLRTLGR